MQEMEPMRKRMRRRRCVPCERRRGWRKRMEMRRRATERMLWKRPRVLYKIVEFKHLGG